METYIAVRCHGLKTRLLSIRDYEAIIRGKKSISDFPDYKHVVEGESPCIAAEKIFQVFVDRVRTLITAAPGLEEFLRVYPDRLEIENIKIKIREIMGRKARTCYYPYSHHIPLDVLKSITTEERLWDKLKDTPYMMEVRKPEFTANVVAEREAFLDSLYFTYVRRILARYGRRSKKILLPIVEWEATSKLAYWSIVFGEGVKDLFKRNIIEGLQPYRKLARADVENLLSLLGISSEDISQILGNQELSRLLLELEKRYIKYMKRIVRSHPVELPYVYYYMALALNEAYNLERIIISKVLHIPENEITAYIVC